MTKAEMETVLAPALYIGRCPEQVTRYLEKLAPVLEGVTGDTAQIDL